MQAKELLGLDLGVKRTGIARASNVARIAEPLPSVPTSKLINFMQDYVNEHKVEAVVVGLPRNLKGEETAQTQWVRKWVNRAKDKINLPFYWQDEALTSKLAVYKNRSPNSRSQKTSEDSLAAAIILQDFLDSAENGRSLA